MFRKEFWKTQHIRGRNLLLVWRGRRLGKSETDETVWENKEKGLQVSISDGKIQCDGLSEKDLGALENNTEVELNIINQLLSKANLTGTSVRKSISNMTEGYDYYDTEILLNGVRWAGFPSMVIWELQALVLRLKTVISTYRFRFS